MIGCDSRSLDSKGNRCPGQIVQNPGEGRWRSRGNRPGAAAGGPGRAIALAALSALLLGAVACGGDDDDSSSSDDEEATSGSEATDLLGPEDAASGEPVKIGMVSDGATQAFDNTDELRGAQAAAEYWNTHQAGVAGRPIEVVTCETGADPGRRHRLRQPDGRGRGRGRRPQPVRRGGLGVGAAARRRRADDVPADQRRGPARRHRDELHDAEPARHAVRRADRGGRERGHRPDRLRQHRRPPGQRLVRLGGRPGSPGERGASSTTSSRSRRARPT